MTLAIGLSHRSHTSLCRYPTLHHFVTQMCTHVHISVTKWCSVGYGTGALWDLCNRSMAVTWHTLLTCTYFSISISLSIDKYISAEIVLPDRYKLFLMTSKVAQPAACDYTYLPNAKTVFFITSSSCLLWVLCDINKLHWIHINLISQWSGFTL